MDRSMWRPTTEDELVLAAEIGTLDESTPGLELKALIPTTRGTNKELARDLASLSIGGGTLLVGVADSTDRDPDDPTTALVPLSCSGLPERVEQIAFTRCDPPLRVSSHVIQSAANSELGYLVVDIPASPLAPHMVDGRYWGRGEHTKRHLTDIEVERLLRRRDALDQSAGSELDAYIERDPFALPEYQRELGHLFLVGIPLQANDTMLLDVVDRDDWVWTTARQQAGPGTGAWSPAPHDLTNSDRRDDGWAATSHEITTGRTVSEDSHEEYLLEIEMSEGGKVRLYSGRITDVVGARGDDPGNRVVFDVAVAGNTRHFIHMIEAVADQAQYRGIWALGVSLTGVEGAQPYSIAQNWLVHDPPMRSAGIYRELTRASTAEVVAAPGSVTERLVGRFLRSVRVANHERVAPFLADPENGEATD